MVDALKRLGRVRVLFLVFLVVLAALPAGAVKEKGKKTPLDELAFRMPETWTTVQGVGFDELSAVLTPAQLEKAAPVIQAFQSFRTATGTRWNGYLDRVTGRPSLIEGGVPWIPGTGMGNRLHGSDIGVTDEVARANAVPVEIVAEKALALLRAYPDLFGVDPADLELMAGASGPMLDYLYYLNFRWTYHGIPVENAYLGFYLNSGNLVQLGAANVSSSISRLDPTPKLSLGTAWEGLWGFVGGRTAGDKIVDEGRLAVLPMGTPALLSGADVDPGAGMEYRLAWIVSFRRAGQMGTWEARIDAHTGELISFGDVNDYGHVQGGVYKVDANPTHSEVVMPFPYADYGATSFADAAGNFTGTTGTGTMTGRTGSAGNVGAVDIVDTCGAISLAADGTGLINFGVSSATDCSSPGGGAGNTRAARTQYWNVAQIKIKAYTYLSGAATAASWLQGRLTDNVNLNQTCNAYWSSASGTVNFFRSGGGCGNTGELPGVSLHEFGHGMDANDGNGKSPEGGTGEIYGDTTGFLQTHESCMGGGFLGSNCSGYGHACTSCTGVRDVDYAKHTGSEMATPLGFNNAHCGTATCVGPCNRECHCENAPGVQANWDLAVRVLTAAPYGLDSATAWQYLDKFWYASAPNRAGAFVCGNNTSTAVGNLFNQYRLVDDCDGNLTNGTPHAAAIWTALGTNHQIGNSSAVNTDNDCGCAALTTPALAGTPGNNSNTLNWGAISGAASYDVYRNETSCTAGYTKVGNTTSLTFDDTACSNGVTYYYVIQAKGSGSCPPSAMSNCVSLVPIPCTMPGAPTIGTVTVPGNNQLQVSWTPGSPAGATYNIYRAMLASAGDNCTTGTYVKIATGDTASPYLDSTVSGTVTYGYRITAVDSTGGCESAQSGCAKATATGTCNAPPNFAGLTSVTNSALATCTLSLAWSAGSAWCGGPLTYNVYRSTTTPFTPAAGNRIASGLGTTSYTDATGLANGTTYYYIVRAVDSAIGAEETNVVTKSGSPTGPITTSNWTDTFEGALSGGGFDQAGWSHSAVSGTTNWTWSTAQKFDGTHSWFAQDIGTASDMILVSPTFGVGAGTTVSFRHTYAFESTTTCYDGGTLEYTTDGGGAWTVVPDADFTAGLFNGTVSSGFSNPIGGKRAWCGGTVGTMTQVTVNLGGDAALLGKTVQLRWHEGNDSSTVGTGWYVDTVVLTNAQVAGSCVTGSGCTAPGAPALAAPTVSCSGIALSWSAGTGSTASYNVYRATATGGPYTKIAGPQAGTTYSDTTGSVGTTYFYVVRGACDAGGATESANSNERSAIATGIPAAPTNVSVTPGCTGNSVSWTASAGATAHDVVRGTVCGTAVTTFSNVTSPYNDTSAVAGTAYQYWVVARNGCGTSANSSCVAGTRLATPAAPGAPTLTPGCTNVSLSWSAVSGATDYEVWRKAGASCSGATQLVSTTGGAASYNNTGLTNGTQYSYYVLAKNSCGTSAAGSCATTTTLAVPAQPTGLRATADCNGVALAWTDVSGATSYNVLRGSTCGTVSSLATGVGAASYTDTTGTPGTAYSYAVQAVNACGPSTASACVAGTRTACPNLVYKSGSFALSQRTGDGDSTSMSPGEKWRLSFVLTNTGTGAATSAFVTVTANNGVSSTDFCVSPLPVGNVAAFADSATLDADFVIPSGWSGTCPSDIAFGFITKSHNGGASAGSDEAPGSSSVVAVKKAMGTGTAGTPTDLVIQPAIADTYVREDNTTNYGGATTMVVQTRNGARNRRAFVQFDLSGIPAGATINSATLELYATAGGTDRTLDVDQITATWAEASVNWSTQPTFNATPVASVAMGTATGAWKIWNIQSLVQSWVGGTANYGVLVKDSVESFSNTAIAWTFATRENATTANRPILRVNYTPSGSVSCAAWIGTASCSTAPKPAPDGQFVTGSPLGAAKASGSNVSVTWDVSACAATNYNIYWAPIGQYTSYAGGSCNIGTSGSWSGAVGDDMWWAIAGTDGGSNVSSIVKQSDGTENPTTGWGAVCSATAMVTTGTCP
jgi:fibronectin type 3 domain-containing protein